MLNKGILMIGSPYDEFVKLVEDTLLGQVGNKRTSQVSSLIINEGFRKIFLRLVREGHISSHNRYLDEYELQFDIETSSNDVNVNPKNATTQSVLEEMIELQNSDEARIENRNW